jgi:hypothetical protein
MVNHVAHHLQGFCEQMYKVHSFGVRHVLGGRDSALSCAQPLTSHPCHTHVTCAAMQPSRRGFGGPGALSRKQVAAPPSAKPRAEDGEDEDEDEEGDPVKKAARAALRSGVSFLPGAACTAFRGMMNCAAMCCTPLYYSVLRLLRQ